MGTPSGTIIAIDGPAASGKSTIAIALARRLGLALVDTGSMYRAVALLALETGTRLDDSAALRGLAERVSISFRLELPPDSPTRVFLGDREVTSDIRRPEVGEAVSPVSAHREVRGRMIDLQRCLAAGRGAVVEGRDIGTVVFPGASLKIYLDASPAERSRRRYRELVQKGMDVSPEQVAEEIRTRDTIDSSRDNSPLSAAADAVVIDTTGLSVEQVVDRVMEEVSSRGLAAG